jgi:hypothetical protein
LAVHLFFLAHDLLLGKVLAHNICLFFFGRFSYAFERGQEKGLTSAALVEEKA